MSAKNYLGLTKTSRATATRDLQEFTWFFGVFLSIDAGLCDSSHFLAAQYLLRLGLL
jgi:hypothetical protein